VNETPRLAPTIQELQAAGCESLRAIAAGLEERGISAARGGKWSAVQVARLLEAAGSRFDGAKVGAHPKAIYIHTAIHIVATKNRMMLA
jgi:hypothetical protein